MLSIHRLHRVRSQSRTHHPRGWKCFVFGQHLATLIPAGNLPRNYLLAIQRALDSFPHCMRRDSRLLSAIRSLPKTWALACLQVFSLASLYDMPLHSVFVTILINYVR